MEEILVYICANIDKEKQEIIFDQINNYKYPFENLYEEIEKVKEIKNEEDIEIYCVITTKERLSCIEKNEKIKEFLNKISEDKNVKYPIVKKYSLSDEVDLLYIFNSDIPNPSSDIINDVEQVIEMFLEKENPYFLGKQMMLQSFLLQSIKGRKIISVMPEKNSGEWYALLEGGYKLPINLTNLYELEKITSRDIPMFTIYEIDNMLKESCYAYGKLYNPRGLFEEWNDVFLYVLATLKIKYNKENLNILLEDFYEFIEKEICECIEVPTIIDKETFLQATLLNIENIRGYLKGLEESGISKNILLQVQNRYKYLPTLYKIVEKRYPEEVKNKEEHKEFKVEEWMELIKDLEKGSNYEKGIHLEEIANYFIKSIKGLKVSGRRVRLENQEIDLCCYNLSENGFLWELGTVILVECKNYDKPIETKEIRSMIYLMEAKGVNTFILFARNGITAGAKKEILKQLIYERKIIVIDENDLKNIEKTDKIPIEILKEKIEEYNKEDFQLLV